MAAPASAFGAAPQAPTLTVEQVKAAVGKAAKLLEQPEVQTQLEAVKAAAGPDPMMAMMIVLPAATNIMLPILAEYGYQQDQTGFMQFLAASMQHKDDPELVALAQQMREKFVPPEMVPMVSMVLASMAPPPQ